MIRTLKGVAIAAAIEAVTLTSVVWWAIRRDAKAEAEAVELARRRFTERGIEVNDD